MIMKIQKPTKTLKTCKNCRKHKVKCDSIIRLPLQCTYCKKKNLQCQLDIVNAIPIRLDTEVIESLHHDINDLKQCVNDLISRKTYLLDVIAQQNISVYEIQRYIDVPESIAPVVLNDYVPQDEFVVSNGPDKISINAKTAHILFKNYQTNYHHLLPILPSQFYQLDLEDIYTNHTLLFWCIIVTSSLNVNPVLNQKLIPFIKALIVKNCWLTTPRSVYILASLLILTTWPINDDDLSIKILSLAKNLALQLGLHRLEFINEFSHSTNVTLSQDPNLNNLIRERLYKFVTINTNYWLVNKGLLYLNFNGYEEDYIINKATQAKSMPDSLMPNNPDDVYINTLLKISLIQQRINENLNCTNRTTKLINFNMFEVILKDLSKSISDPKMKLSIEYSKLQLYSYGLQKNLQLSLYEYKVIIHKCIKCCYDIISLFDNFDLSPDCWPVHYLFIVDFTALIMLRCYFSPLLDTVKDYQTLKTQFNKIYKLLLMSKLKRVLRIIETFNDIFTSNLHQLVGFTRSFYLITKFNDFQNCNIQYEIIWLIYNFKNKLRQSDLSLESVGIKGDLLTYLNKASIL